MKRLWANRHRFFDPSVSLQDTCGRTSSSDPSKPAEPQPRVSRKDAKLARCLPENLQWIASCGSSFVNPASLFTLVLLRARRKRIRRGP